MVPISHLSKESIETPNEVVNLGDIIDVVVIKVSSSEQKITLSAKDYEKYVEKDELKQFIATEGKSVSGGKLGELLKINLSK